MRLLSLWDQYEGSLSKNMLSLNRQMKNNATGHEIFAIASPITYNLYVHQHDNEVDIS